MITVPYEQLTTVQIRQKSGGKKFKKMGFSCSWADQSCRNFFIPTNRPSWQTVTINFACELRDELRAYTIEN